MHLGIVTMLLALWQVLYAASIKQLASRRPPDSTTYHADATSIQGYLPQSYTRVKCSWSFWFVCAPKNGVGNCTKWKKVYDNGNWTNTSCNVQYQHPGMTWSARTTTDEEFWRRMASKILQVTHKVTKWYIVTSSIIKDILEEYCFRGKDQCVWRWYKVCLTYANSN